MASKWESEKENLEQLILIEKLSYEEVGRRYGCSGANIKKVAKLVGLELPQRRKVNECETFGKGKIKKPRSICLNCGKEFLPQRNTTGKYCCIQCQHDYTYKQWVDKYKNDNSIAKSTKWGKIPGPLRRYIFNKFENKCCQCGWGEINPYTGTLPLEIDHVDGNSENNSEENLRLICPNCHSLTATYRGANRGNGRNITWSIKEKD